MIRASLPPVTSAIRRIRPSGFRRRIEFPLLVQARVLVRVQKPVLDRPTQVGLESRMFEGESHRYQ